MQQLLIGWTAPKVENKSSSVARRWRKKVAQCCPEIAQDNALLNQTFCQRNWVENNVIILTKSGQNLYLINVNFWRFFGTNLRPKSLGDFKQ
jgi:hypothetical protein